MFHIGEIAAIGTAVTWSACSLIFTAASRRIGPFLGVWFSMIAVKNAPIGIASTLMALMPIAILPMVAIVHKEKITWRAAIGAAIAVAGVAILFNV